MRLYTLLFLMVASTPSLAGVVIPAITLCNNLSGLAGTAEAYKLRGGSKGNFIKEDHLIDDKEDYSESYYNAEIKIINDIYSHPENIDKTDEYEIVRHASKVTLKYLDDCLLKVKNVSKVDLSR